MRPRDDSVLGRTIMKGSSKDSNIGRREFVKIATGAVAGAATIGALYQV